MGKERLSKVKSSVQLDYTAGVGTGWDGDTSETSLAKPELQVWVWRQLLAAEFPMAQPDASTRSEAGCSEAGAGSWRGWLGLLCGAPVQQTSRLRPPHCVAQRVLPVTGPRAPAHMCRCTCYKMENECPHSPGAFWLEAKQIYSGSFVSCLNPPPSYPSLSRLPSSLVGTSLSQK